MVRVLVKLERSHLAVYDVMITVCGLSRGHQLGEHPAVNPCRKSMVYVGGRALTVAFVCF